MARKVNIRHYAKCGANNFLYDSEGQFVS